MIWLSVKSFNLRSSAKSHFRDKNLTDDIGFDLNSFNFRLAYLKRVATISMISLISELYLPKQYNLLQERPAYIQYLTYIKEVVKTLEREVNKAAVYSFTETCE